MITTPDETQIADTETQRAVQAELGWSPDVDASGIGVAVDHGAVTLSGQVTSYPERRAAARAAFRVRGVRSIADAIVVHRVNRNGIAWNVTDTDIAESIRLSLSWASDVPEGVNAEVHDQIVTLSGDVEWDFQRESARRVAERTTGVRLVLDEMTLSERPSVADSEELIRDAIVRNATLDAAAVHVEIRGTVAVLTGTVRSYVERSQAGKAAWSSPHVTEVENNLLVRSW